jgi:ATP-dependent RNA helicase RhlE
MSLSSSNASNGFDRFEFPEVLERGIRAAGFEDPRPIQVETIPAALDGADVLGLAQTGTGKTAAFALPLLDRILDVPGKGPRALIVAPTRELATQIAEEIRTLSKFTKLRLVTVFGGVSVRSQINALREQPEIVVGCPGRLLDLLGQGVLKLGRVETLVLDEADHMFDMGFLPDIRRLLAALPKDRQNLLFSATMPKEIRHLADEVLYQPHVVELADAAPASTIDHALYPVAERRKRDLLEHVLTSDECNSAIVFTRTKHRARRLAEQISKAGHRAVSLQGNMSQGQRDRAMSGFRERRYDILVATDIAARGIDVSGVSHVINFDVPNTPEAYTHRIGRTGRAELEGIACTFVTSEDSGWVRATERMIGSPIPRRQIEGFDHGGDEPAESRGNSGSRSGARGPGGSRRGGRGNSSGRGRSRSSSR